MELLNRNCDLRIYKYLKHDVLVILTFFQIFEMIDEIIRKNAKLGDITIGYTTLVISIV